MKRHELLFLGEIPPQSMATTIDDGLSSGREGLSDGEIKPQKLKRMKNHLGMALKHFAVSVEKDKTVSCNVFLPAATVLGHATLEFFALSDSSECNR